jgi:hypothetical protein
VKKKDLDIDVCNYFIGSRVIGDGIPTKSAMKEIGSLMYRDLKDHGRQENYVKLKLNEVILNIQNLVWFT